MATLASGLIYFLLWLISAYTIRRLIFRKPTTAAAESRNYDLPPSPPSLPIIGHLHHLKPYMHKCFNDLSTKYGPLLHIKFGSISFVLVSSSSLVKEIFKTHDLNFASKPQNNNNETSLVLTDNGFVFSPYGDYWRFMKKLIVTELLGPRQLDRSKHVRREEIEQLVKKVMDTAARNGIVDLETELVTLANNVTCRMAMSTRCSGEESEAEMCRGLVKESFELASKMSLTNLLGPFRGLGLWVLKKQSRDVLRRYNLLMDRLLMEHEGKAKRRGSHGDNNNNNGSGDGDDGRDLMDIMLQVYHDERAEFRITITHLKAFFSVCSPPLL